MDFKHLSCQRIAIYHYLAFSRFSSGAFVQIKKFQAETLQDALQMVREEFGPDAAVLHTRQYERRALFGLRRQTVVEVTAQSLPARPLHGSDVPLPQRLDRRLSLYAALDRSPYEAFRDEEPTELWTPDSRSLPGERPLSREQARKVAAKETDEPVEAGLVGINAAGTDTLGTDTLGTDAIGPGKKTQTGNHATTFKDEEAPSDLRDRLFRRDSRARLAACERPTPPESKPLNADNPTLLELELIRKLRQEIYFGGPLRPEPGRRTIVALVGPTGCGKTTTIAKLAAHFHIHERRRVGLLTLDTFRIGAAEQLRGVADVLDIPVEVLSGTRRMPVALERFADRELILFDTPGTSPTNTIKMQTITAALDAARVDEVHLLLPATASAQSLAQVVERFRCVNYTDLTVTKWDESCGLGNLLPVLRGNVQPLRYLTTGQDVPQDLVVADAELLATGRAVPTQ